MGQGAEDAGFYEIEYDPYDGDVSKGFSVWTESSGGSIAVDKMANSHISNIIRLCKQLKKWTDLAN